MTTNYVIQNNGMAQSSVQPQRNRPISVGGAVHVASHYPAFSQPYQTSNAYDASWSHGPQGVYVNGLGKVVNVFPGNTVQDVDDLTLNQSNETYKYTQELKLSNGPHAGGQVYHHHSNLHGVSGPAHGTLQTPVQLTAMVATPSGVAQSHTGALRTDSFVHSHGSHQSQGVTSGLPVFLPGYLGQQQHAPIQHPQNAISPSMFTDNTAPGMCTNTPSLSTYHTKHVSLSGPTDNRIMSPPQASFTHLPVAHHPVGSHDHPPIYPTSSLHHPPPSQLTSTLPHGLVELIPTMFPTADPHIGRTPFSQPSTVTYSPYSAQLPTAVSVTSYEPMNLPLDTGSLTHNSRVRHNTWSGLESNLSVHKADSSILTNNSLVLGSGRTGTDRQRTFSHHASGVSVNPFQPASNSYDMSALLSSSSQSNPVHAPSMVQHSTSRDMSQFTNVFEKSNRASGPSVWHHNIPADPPFNRSVCGVSVGVRNNNPGMDGVYNLYPGSSRMELKNSPNKPFGNASNLQLADEEHQASYLNANRMASFPGSVRNRDTAALNGNRWPVNQPGSVFRPFHPRPLGSLINGGKPMSDLNPSHNLAVSKLPVVNQQWNFPYAFSTPSNTGSLMHAQNQIPWSVPAHPFSDIPAPIGSQDQFSLHRQRFLPPHLNGNPIFNPTEAWSNSAVMRPDHFLNLTNQNNGLRMLFEACPLRILVSTLLVGAVIGRGGRTIRRMTARTGAQIDFKSEIVAFSQFSAPVRGGTRSFPVSIISSDQSQLVDPNENDTKTTACTASSSSSPSQTDRSQLVHVSGTPGQRSAALAEILTICFREAGHKGLPEPCLGLVVQQQVYTQLIMGQGRKYFNSIHCETGARVTATGSPVSFNSTFAASQHPSPVEPSIDRILVIRGSLVSMCVAEFLISEKVRILTAELFIPFILWPLLPHLPLAHLSFNKRSLTIDGLRSDLKKMSHSLLSIADVFWPQSVAAMLAKHPSFAHAAAFDNASTCSPSDQPVTSSLSANSKSDEPNHELSKSAHSSVCSSPINLDHVTSDHDSPHSVNQLKELACPTRLACDMNEIDAVQQPDPNSLPDGDDTNLNEDELALAIAVQQSLITTVGPLAWLATSGTLHLRISFNEAGVLIGAGGHRIHQLMKTTGTEVHVSKTPINGPYALNCHDDINKAEPQTMTEKSSPSMPTDIDSPIGCDPEQVTSDAPLMNEEVLTKPTQNKEDTSPQVQSDGEISEDQNQLTVGAQFCFTSTEEDHSTQDSSLDAPNLSSSTIASQSAGSNSHRLVTLSGPFQSQLMAQWKIFQRLKLLYDKAESMRTSRAGNEANKDEASKANDSVCSTTSFRLATVVCLPFHFLCWLASSNSGFADFMSTSKSPVKSNEPDRYNTRPSVGPIRTESNSPLSWLRSQAQSHHDSKSKPDQEACIHILPEPRRRRRLIQQQLRRMTGPLRRGPYSKPVLTNIVLPSVGLTHDGLDALWSDPNRAPLEVYGDYATTQVILAHLHHMLAMWLYGQALTNPASLSFIPMTPSAMPPPQVTAAAAQAPLFVFPPSMWVPGQNDSSRPPPPVASMGEPIDLGARSLSWAASYPHSTVALHNQQRGQVMRFGTGCIRNAEYHNPTYRYRPPNFETRWRNPSNPGCRLRFYHASGSNPSNRPGIVNLPPSSTFPPVSSVPDRTQPMYPAHNLHAHQDQFADLHADDLSTPTYVRSRASSDKQAVSQSPDNSSESMAKHEEIASSCVNEAMP